MIYLSYLSFLLFGIILGVGIHKYLVPFFDILLDLYSYKQTQKAMKYQINTQIINMEFLREYPEANQNYQELQPAIGFNVGKDDEGYYEDCGDGDIETKSKNMIGF